MQTEGLLTLLLLASVCVCTGCCSSHRVSAADSDCLSCDGYQRDLPYALWDRPPL